MNIFYLSADPREAAQMLCDKHCVKMPLETAQMLSTAHRIAAGNDFTAQSALTTQGCYAETHANHPCSKWVRETSGNYAWAVRLFKELLAEYTFRYGKTHASARLLPLFRKLPANIPLGNPTPPAQAMPEEYRNSNLVIAYRNYYWTEKSPIAEWRKGRSAPDWWVERGIALQRNSTGAEP